MINRRFELFAILTACALAATLDCASARAEDASESCKPLAAAQAEVNQAGAGKFAPLTHDQVMFARGLFVASPPVSPYPKGEDAMLATFENGVGVVVFVDGDMSCARLNMTPPVTAILIELGKTI